MIFTRFLILTLYLKLSFYFEIFNPRNLLLLLVFRIILETFLLNE